ncbi:MAG TPA: hypothetical protein DEB06_02645 [Phycisphaerales bacterium]|nr:hypothetical protein [Phycisphaerales bacterium]
MRVSPFFTSPVAVLALAGGAYASDDAPVSAALSAAREGAWSSFVDARTLHEELRSGSIVLIDVRSASKYAQGHIPGAINIPAEAWRTPDTKPGEGVGSLIHRLPSGLPDVGYYERLLGAAGVERGHDVVVYGNFAGKADGTIPVVILRWLGAARVRFLDGVGAEEWVKTGQSLTPTPTVRPPAAFVAQPQPGVVWTLTDVLGHLGESEVVFLDCRTEGEFQGTDLRGNKRAGRIPGAVWLDSQTLLDEYSKKTIPKDRVLELLAERGVTPEKTVVIYCQTGTRCSLPFIQLQDLGFNKVALYDESWLEYGNRDDTPVEAP